MRLNDFKISLKTAVLAVTILLLGVGVSAAQQQINLNAGPSSITLPDGSLVSMWGYSCGSAVASNPAPSATCAALNPAATGAWSPVVITVPTGQSLQINLTNGLPVPTSMVIVGQLGGGLGAVGTSCIDGGVGHGVTCTSSPDHSNAQLTTWPIADPTTKGAPPAQGPRVQSMATEVAGGGGSASLTWTTPRPGTYLIESGTHPSIQGPMGLYGMLVVTQAPVGTTAGVAYGSAATAVSYSAEVPLLMSEIDPVQNNAVAAAVATPGFSETKVWSGQPGGCGNPASGAAYQTCYPPAVNYTPLYYLFNGVAFNKTNAPGSLFLASPAGTALSPVSGNLLVRLVNAGLRMHVPSIVGAQTGGASAVPGFQLIAEDGNPLPGVPRVQSEAFMAAGKTQDVMVNVPAAGGSALPIFDREGSLSANAIARDAGMLAYIGINGSGLPSVPAIAPAVARADTYNSVISGQTLTVSDPGKGVIQNDTNVYGVKVFTAPSNGTVTLNANGTFTYVPSGTATSDSFVYASNGAAVCQSPLSNPGPCALVTLGLATKEDATGIVMGNISYTSNLSRTLSIKSPGVLLADKDNAGFSLTAVPSSVAAVSGLTVSLDKSGAFNASIASPCTTTLGCTYTFTYNAQNSQGTVSSSTATVAITFQAKNGPHVTLVDGAIATHPALDPQDYRWIIEEDRTFYVDPNCTTNPPPAGCPTLAGSQIVPTLGTNFHTSYMPIVATGCVGHLACESGQMVLGVAAVCDGGNGACRTGASQQDPVDPTEVHLDPTKRYYISVLPGDGADALAGDAALGHAHGMGGAQIAAGQTNVTVIVEPTPLQPAKLSVFVFEDDFPLNGEQDGGGGIDVLSPQEPGLGNFQITLFDDAGGTGDATGQPTYDMFNMPLSNALAGTLDPVTGNDACPISQQVTQSTTTGDGTQAGITGMIVTCPKYESDGTTLSPLAGQAVVANLYPGRYGVVATPGADRIARGEEWLQTNTLDGQHAHDSFLRVGEPSYFQEYGPAGYHVSIGFANPAIINARKADLCNTLGTCSHSVTGKVEGVRMSRTPDERLYTSGSRDIYGFTQCFVSLGDPEGQNFAFEKCDADGNFTFTGIPSGDWRVAIFDQWNDQIVDGISTPIRVGTGDLNMGELGSHQWQADISTQTFFDQNGDGIRQDAEPGLSLVSTNVRFRDGSFSNFNSTDLAGNAGFNEVFPLFAWYVIETDSTRYKSTGTHVVYDAGGPADGSPSCGTAANGFPACGTATGYQFLANTSEPTSVALPTSLRVPGGVYCSDADCLVENRVNFPTGGGPGGSTGRIDPPTASSYGWQGFAGQTSFLEFGKKPFAPAENGGIHGTVVYASTRPFDDPQLLLQLSWEPLVPHVTINLYQEGTDPATGAQTLKLVDTTQTSSFDDWAQGFRTDVNGNILRDASGNAIPNMNCPGQTTSDLFYYGLLNQPNYLDFYNSLHGGPAPQALASNAQFKCYDGMHNWNQLQPAPYDGMYQFPSVTRVDPSTGKPVGTNCHMATLAEPWGCTANPTQATVAAGLTAATDPNYDPWRAGQPMLAAGKYVVEVVVPPGYELVKEEDKNILIGDTYIAPATQQFGPLGSIYIMPDQATVAANYNGNNSINPTSDLGRASNLPSHEGDTGTVETFWPCVGQARIVPDFISLFPGSGENSPFAGATRNLCDRKEVTVDNQMAALAKFYVFTSTHAASHYTGIITDDFTGEFDPFSPQFGEKFAPANLPVSLKDFNGNEVARTYSDHFGAYNGLNYSSWEVNPPNPTGYAPTMMVTCMNDGGPIMDTRATIKNSTGATVPNPTLGQMITDPLYQAGYSDFCYELPFMPGQTGYFDTPVIPTSAFAEGYNHPDCSYPDATPAISEVDGDTSTTVTGGGTGPWVSAAGHLITIHALGEQPVNNYGYSGPSATTAPYNQKTVMRHYGFGLTPGTVALVDKNGLAHPLGSPAWGDLQITGTVPTLTTAQSTCPIQQQRQYGAPATNTVCGQLVITAANGKQSIDTVTVTIGGKQPTHVAASGSIQSAIDAAMPGDLIIVDPTTKATATAPAAPSVHSELLLMWKPVRLQGVGGASSIIDGNPHPAAKLDAWRRQVVCLFGLALNGRPISNTNPYDVPGGFTCSGTSQSNDPLSMRFAIDRLPLEATVGWDATLNGNLAEMLQEPTLMGAYEGAAITVLSKGVKFPNGSDPFGSDVFPVGTALLTNAQNNGGCGTGCGANGVGSHNPFPSNFLCNPSSIDGLGITNSSQGGGGIFIHAWGHNLQIANNRIYNNQGTLSGGITVGQGEHPDAYLGGAGVANADPGSCQTSNVTNLQLPYCFDQNVNVHHNLVTLNSSEGDELFSSTPAGAGGVSFCTGADFYKFNYNWVCGNMSTGDGGGVAHLGFIYNGDIEHNSILFNQSTNPTIPTNGGGLMIMGAPDVDPTCGATTDQDCVPTPGSIGPGDGTGPGLVINANLIMGNAAESGSGGGLRFQMVNGTDVINFPLNPTRWNSVSVTNNMITNNVAGWDGAGVSLNDALNVNFVNNTIASNDTTASSGELFNTLFAPLASSNGCKPGQTPPCTVDTSTPQPAGLVVTPNSSVLSSSLPATIICPVGHSLLAGDCRQISYPLLYNNVFWQNRAFNITVGALVSGFQQNVVTLVPTLNQTSTGQCVSGASYWDIGVRGDTGPGNHASGYTLSPNYSVLTNTGALSENGSGANNLLGSNPNVVSQYCNGSRTPPEFGGSGFQVPPGTWESGAPVPVFSLAPAATTDESNNWINMRWGPLSLTNPVSGAVLGNYGLTASSPAIDQVPLLEVPALALIGVTVPTTDFYGNPRPAAPGTRIDIGAVEYKPVPGLTVGGGPLAFGNVTVGTTSAAQTLTFTNTAAVAASVSYTISAPFSRAGSSTCGAVSPISVPAGGSCNLNVVFTPPSAATFSGSVTVTSTNVPVTGSPVGLSGTGVALAVVGFSGPTPALTTTPATRTVKTGTITVGNTGTANLVLTAAPTVVKTAGPAAGTFVIVAPNSGSGPQCLNGTSVAPGGTCRIGVQYTPPATGTIGTGTAHIVLTDTGAAATTQSSGNFNAN